MVIDRDDNVLVLTDDGVYIVLEEQLVKDRRFRPLTDLVPVDITLQSGSGAVYYLYDDHYLTNAWAGLPYGEFESGLWQQIAVNASGDLLLAGGEEYEVVTVNPTNHSVEQKRRMRVGEEILAVKAEGEQFYLQTPSGIYRLRHEILEPVVEDSRIEAWSVAEGYLLLTNQEGYYAVNPEDGEELVPLKTRIPVSPVRSLAFRDGKLWAGSEAGMFSSDDFDTYRYFASRRWLPDDRVLDVGADSRGNGYALTEQGVAEVRYLQMTLGDKADYFYDKVRRRHLRLGLIGEVRLAEPGDLTTTEMIDTDNDGLWTSFYVGSEVFRYAATGDPQARDRALETFMSFERLLSVNQLDGFPSRTFERTGFKVSDLERWRDSPEEQWEWKGHTSSDEFVAYIWLAGILDRHADLNESEQERVAAFIDDIMMHIIRNDYYFVDIDGEPTLWGRWNPEYLNSYPESVVDRKLGSLTITAGLQLAWELTGKELYRQEAGRLFEEHGYLENIKIPMENIRSTPDVFYQGMDMGAGGWNHSDDEMAFLTYYILYHYAFDSELQQIYADVISDHWQIELPERNSLWSLLTFGTSGDIDLDSVVWHLREFQLDMVRWDIRNSHRGDLEFLEDNFRGQTTRELLPPSERMTIRYNANPFALDGGRGGLRELAGDEFLLPYWMGRHLGVIVPDVEGEERVNRGLF